MGRRGPAPTPAKIKLIQGETRPSRVNFSEPLPSASLPRMPRDMDPAAKAAWRRVVRSMGASGVIRMPDTDSLRCYCEAVSRYAEAARLYAASGPLLKRRGGAFVKNPLHQIVREDAEAIRLFARELGLTPSARSGLHVEPERGSDWLEDGIGLPPRLRAVANDA